MTKLALVTGAAGFVGRHMRTYLEDNSWSVIPIDIREHDGDRWVERVNVMDAFSRHGYMSTNRKFDLVVHCAAAGPHRKAIDNDLGGFPYNVALDAAMFEWAIRTKQKRIVYFSSSAIYPSYLQLGTHLLPEAYNPPEMDWRLVEDNTNPIEEPADTYGFTKLVGERMALQAQSAGISVTVVRPFSGYGEDQSRDFPFAAFVLRAKALENPFHIWGHAGQVRDWIHIDDIVRAIMALVEAEVNTPVNLCTGVGTSMSDLAQQICAVAGYTPDFQVIEDAPMGVFYRVGNPTLLESYYRPLITIEEGIERALRRN